MKTDYSARQAGQYQVASPIHHDGQLYTVGASIQLTAQQARALGASVIEDGGEVNTKGGDASNELADQLRHALAALDELRQANDTLTEERDYYRELAQRWEGKAGAFAAELNAIAANPANPADQVTDAAKDGTDQPNATAKAATANKGTKKS